MKIRKRDWLWLVLLPFASSLLVDQAGKALARKSLSTPISLSLLQLQRHENFGFMLGIGSNLPPSIKILALVTIAGFFVASVAMFQMVMIRRLSLVRIGLSIFAGGVIGNTVDRMRGDFSLDFLQLRIGGLQSSIFNLADVFQWVGYGLILLGLFKYRRALYPKSESRTRLLINPTFQLRFFGVMLALSLSFSVVAGFFAWAYLRVVLREMGSRVQGEYLWPFVLAFAAITLAFLLLTLLFAIRISHRIAGPMIALERYLAKRLAGEESNFRVRDGDETSHIKAIVELLQKQKKN